MKSTRSIEQPNKTKYKILYLNHNEYLDLLGPLKNHILVRYVHTQQITLYTNQILRFFIGTDFQGHFLL